MRILLFCTSVAPLLKSSKIDGYTIGTLTLLKILMDLDSCDKVYSMEIIGSNETKGLYMEKEGKYVGIQLWVKPIVLSEQKLSSKLINFLQKITLAFQILRTKTLLKVISCSDIVIINNHYLLVPFVVLFRLLKRKVIVYMGDVASFGRPLYPLKLLILLFIELIYSLFSYKIVFVTEDEYIYFSRLFKRKNDTVIPFNPLFTTLEKKLQVKEKPLIEQLSRRLLDKRVILFSAGSLYIPVNKPAVEFIISYLAPQFKNRRDMIFVVTGSRGEGWLDASLPENVYLTGLLPRKVYDWILSRADICIAPMSYNTGLKTRVLEYIFNKKITIISPQASLGLPCKKLPSVFVSKLDTFPKTLEYVLENLERIIPLTEKTYAVATEYFSFDRIKQMWESLLTGILRKT